MPSWRDERVAVIRNKYGISVAVVGCQAKPRRFSAPAAPARPGEEGGRDTASVFLPHVAGTHVSGGILEPTEDDLRFIDRQIAEAKRALTRIRNLDIPTDRRKALDQRIANAEAALNAYESLAMQGKPRQKAKGLLYAAGATLMIDDATLVGTADNVLLPLVAA